MWNAQSLQSPTINCVCLLSPTITSASKVNYERKATNMSNTKICQLKDCFMQFVRIVCGETQHIIALIHTLTPNSEEVHSYGVSFLHNY